MYVMYACYLVYHFFVHACEDFPKLYVNKNVIHMRHYIRQLRTAQIFNLNFHHSVYWEIFFSLHQLNKSHVTIADVR